MISDKDRKDPSEQNPWRYAQNAGRDYLTPEDISAAIEADPPADRSTLLTIVLRAIADGRCEDTRCCAFVAVEGVP